MQSRLIKEMHYARIPVTNLEAAVEWYVRCLGLEHAWSENGMAMVRQEPSPLLILMQADPGTYSHFTVDGEPVESLTFVSDDLDRFHQHLAVQGVQVEPIRPVENGFRLFRFYDRDGNLFQVHS